MELANPPLVDLRDFRGTKNDRGAYWRNYVKQMKQEHEHMMKESEQHLYHQKQRREEQANAVLPDGFSGESGPFVVPPGWFPGEEDGDEGDGDANTDPATRGFEPDVNFAGGLCGDVEEKPLDVLMMMIRMVARIELEARQ